MVGFEKVVSGCGSLSSYGEEFGWGDLIWKYRTNLFPSSGLCPFMSFSDSSDVCPRTLRERERDRERERESRDGPGV